MCGLQVYLNDRNNFLTRRTSPFETSGIDEAEPPGPASGSLAGSRSSKILYDCSQNRTDLGGHANRKSIWGADCCSAALFGLLVVGLLGSVSSARAQTPALKNITCSAVTLVSPGTVTCSVALSAPAPAGGLPVQLTSGSPVFSVPASVVVEAGRLSAVFSATASPVASAESATVTAGSGTGQLGTAVSLLSSTSPVQVVAKNSGKCLDVRGFSTDAGANVQQWSCGGGPNQHWLFIATGDRSYQVKSVNSSMSLGVDRNSDSNGAPIIQWPYLGFANEKWQLKPMGNGYYTLVAASTGKCLDVRGGPSATGDGVDVQQWDCWGGDNQAWELVSQHSVSLSWDASTSSDVTGYYVYRRTTSGGPYTKLSSLLSGTSYVDGTVQAGQTYYYATTAANSSGDESAYSNQVQATIPAS